MTEYRQYGEIYVRGSSDDLDKLENGLDKLCRELEMSAVFGSDWKEVLKEPVEGKSIVGTYLFKPTIVTQELLDVFKKK